MGKKVSAFRDPATRIDGRPLAAPAAWQTEEEETKTSKNSTAAAAERYEQRLIIIRVRCQYYFLIACKLQGFLLKESGLGKEEGGRREARRGGHFQKDATGKPG